MSYLRTRMITALEKANERRPLLARQDIEYFATAALEAIRPVEEVKLTEPVICYFTTEEDREEFIQAIQEVKPDMRLVKV